MVKKILWWLFAAFLVFFVAFRPAAAASVTRWIGGTLSGMARGIGDYFAHLVT